MPDYLSLDLDGISIAYLDMGQGDPVLLLHGFASTAAVNWGRTGWIAALTDDARRVVAPDMRGHGRSAKFYDPPAYRLEPLAADILGLLDRLRIERVDVVGYSMGARVGAYLVTRQPQRVRSLVLGGIGMRLVEGSAEAEQIAAAAESVDPEAAAPGLGPIFRRYADWTGSDLRALAAAIRGQTDAIPARALAAIRTPVLVAAGSKDELAQGAAELAALIPGAELLILEGQDHMRAVGHTRTFRRRVMDFLRRRP